ncbi:peptidoglycan-binding protein [Streptomyces sp. NPDC099050]|uniref:peptidoglycan-binding domain-containing protein n=1 Tax=Streptomyces sp. NPDC099050 TaxID=3366100 RepID=UPI003818437F
MRRKFAALAASLLTGVALGIAPLSTAEAATPTCDWVASYAGAWVPMYKAGNTVNCNMVRGTNSPAVQKLQHSMNLCYGESLVEDGDFGGNTRNALIRTQIKAGTAADGEYGPNTRRAMLHQGINGGCIRVP